MKRLFTLFALVGLCFSAQDLQAQYEGSGPFCHQGGGLFINEISNGPTTGQNNKEYIEMIVTPDPSAPLAPVNLEGWILDDNNVAASGEGNATGHFILGDCYQAVPPGSILVIYNPEDPNPALPADDPTDANQDGVYIIPANDACVRACNSNPVTDNPNYCPCADPETSVSGWQIGLRNPGDVFQIRDACETVVHAISWGGLQLDPDVQNSPAYFRLNGDSQSGLVIRFTNFVSNDWNDATNYDNPPVATGETPGAPNNAENAAFIALLQTGAFMQCGGTIYDCRITDAGDLQAPDGITEAPIVLCAGDDLGAFTAVYDQPDETEPMAPGFDFEYAFLITSDQSPEYPIMGYSYDGDFDYSGLPEGNYRLWGLSYIQPNGSLTLDILLSNIVSSIADIQNYSACGDDLNLDSLNQMGQVVEIQVIAAPVAVMPADPLSTCTTDPNGTLDLTLFDAEISDGSPLPVVWYSDANATQPIVDPANFPAATTTVFARLESASCNSNIVSVDLEIGGSLMVEIMVDEEPDCDNPLAAISLNVPDPSGLVIDWNIDAWDGQTALMDVAPGSYSVTVTDVGGCRDSSSIRINPGGTSVAEYLTTNPTCQAPASGVIRLEDIVGSSGPYEISFNGSAYGPSDGWQMSGLTAGSYLIVLRDNSGCESAQSVTLSLPAGPSLELGPDVEINEGESTFIRPVTSGSLSNLSWSPLNGVVAERGGLTLRPTETTTYSFTISDANGCTTTDQLTVTVIPSDNPPPPPVPEEQTSVFIPNAFSPNEDGFNDSFTIFGDETVANIRMMRIFDRWGSLVFETSDMAPNDLQQGWRGQVNGRPMPEGVYIYFLEVEFTDGTTTIMKGEVVMIR
ncbi:gliding motility-associated C-terminal domain-containing protein [Flavilitoribacter nigricans]|uniref:LTD domain-containing protein n=1 Tax=Flavilitoribacter nigricans (strain ATCC 23147 / DSM 23189 / NBRC 102662 / NCIMB 1420 / SS-2) TaxID=1122177 RepID=A0A2D0N9A5_FLAN2|nr:gliding motility-associated C-terminal domain-containing protein [Flavilitoribacter nigricans]PHN05065.1 hypothetical protein CRP01_18750 [Flavilitoribacter nigricans DSM 23189 = NBRC 102662]